MSLSSFLIQWTSGSENPASDDRELRAVLPPLGELTQNVLLLATAQLPVRREAGGVLDEDVVKDRHADFERIQHAHPIHLGQNVGHHVGLVSTYKI